MGAGEARRLGRLVRLSEAAEGPPVVLRTAMAATAAEAVDSRQLGLDPEPVRVAVRCTTTWELVET